MSYILGFSIEAETDIQRLKQSGDKSVYKKLVRLLGELQTNPKTGTGKPEQLKFRGGMIWSRRISSKHRLVYRIDENKIKVFILSAYGYYIDK